ncbi:MAG: hypothetical protein PHE55_18970 [Methylococcaceae bacterium]|nr:hypothetical protein [Methylococcaceae bacterium]
MDRTPLPHFLQAAVVPTQTEMGMPRAVMVFMAAMRAWTSVT